MAAVLCGAASVQAATTGAVSPLPDLDLNGIGDVTLQALLRDDALGGGCIAEDDIALAFFATGKGMRLPRTCLPDACDQALTPFRLASLIGRPAGEGEWDRYFARYADACRKELVSFDGETAAPLDNIAFWAPIVGSQVAQGALGRSIITDGLLTRRAEAPVTLPQGLGGSAFAGSGPNTAGGTGIASQSIPDTPGTNRRPGAAPNTDEDQPLTPVPLPAAAWFLLSALMGLVGVRRVRG